MKKLTAIVMMMALTMPILVMAETIQEGVKKHPKSSFYYLRKKTWKQEIPPMSAIERIAIDAPALKAYIKFYDSEEEIEWRIQGADDIDGVHFYILTGATIGFDLDKEVMYYKSSTLNEVFDWDFEKSASADRLSF